ncbi:MAG: TRAP transporter substrate-binding protein DctP [Deltaproteobacteria bacterium]|jgi:TRAP-type C4-dicarboxylate transport system substrate-binding protein|nr:TRAP transporter substrate-binding protein DctP [Deltaproteobacteria bacterium]
MKSLKILALICLLALGLIYGPVAQAAKIEAKLGMEEIDGSVQDTYAQNFKKLLLTSAPDLDLQIFPVGVLGDAGDMAEQVMNGVIQFDMPTSHLASFIPMVRIFGVPYIWSNNMEVNKELMTSSKALYEILGAAYAANGMKLLAIFPEGWQQWSSNKPLRNLDDFKNLRIRVMSDPLLAEIYKAYGANPLQISYSEIYSALQLNQLDANIQPLFAHQEMSFYEQQDYFTNPFEMPFVSTFVVNQAWFDAQPKNIQDAIVKAAQDSVGYTIAEADKMNAERKEIMAQKKPSLVFYELTPEEQAPFRAKAPQIEAIFVKMAGPEGQRLLDTLKVEREALEAAAAKK